LGFLPYSRAKNSTGYGMAKVETNVLAYPRTKMQTLINQAPQLTEELVHFMVSRVRQFTSQNLQTEKMLSLGKLSAGLTHELNNPIAAIHRDADQLGQLVGSDQLSQLVLGCTGLDHAGKDELITQLEKWKSQSTQGKLKPLERSRMENSWMDWMEELGLEDADEDACAFTDFGLKMEEVEHWLGRISKEQQPLFIHWISYLLQTESLVKNIQNASSRVATLIGAVKSYTHMDRAQEKQELDLNGSLRDTLMILGHKIKANQVEISLQAEDPEIKLCGLVGELNQVWTNLIDNALDAVAESDKPQVEIKLSKDKDQVTVEITDNGAGIPEEDLPKIFDPFFTTKEMGKGTGMGLDLVNQIIQKHQGTISVKSEPGKTSFLVNLPIS